MGVNINKYETISELSIIWILILIEYLKLSGLYSRGEMNLSPQ